MSYLTSTTYHNVTRKTTLTVVHDTNGFAEFAEIISDEDKQLNRTPDILTVKGLNAIWEYWVTSKDNVDRIFPTA